MLKNSINYKMRPRSFGLCAVVLWLSAIVPSSTKAHDCRAPVIENGFFASGQNTVPHATQLHYTCNTGYKPVVARVTCQNGQWSSQPQCIDETACFDPDIPNANYSHVPFVKHGSKVRIRCNRGYEDKKKLAVALCENGQWTKFPVCQKKESWCGPPPKLPNALIISEPNQEMFPEDAEVEYKCHEGFEPDSPYSMTYCRNGVWLSLPSCNSSMGSSSDGGNNKPIVDKCSTPPVIANGDFLRKDNSTTHLKYQCKMYYKLQGDSSVMCHANGSWTTPPECVEDFCELNTVRYKDLVNTGVVFIQSGAKVKLNCRSSAQRNAHAHCVNRQLQLTKCCSGLMYVLRKCGLVQMEDPL